MSSLITPSVGEPRRVPVSNGSAFEPRLVPSLLSIAKSTRAFLALLLAEIDLHPGQDQLLDKLHPGEQLSVSMLADQLAVRPSTVSKMLDRLIEKDLVVRSANSSDARRTMVTLTEKGMMAQAAVHRIWARLEADLGGTLSDGEIESIGGALEQAGELLSTRLRRLR